MFVIDNETNFKWVTTMNTIQAMGIIIIGILFTVLSISFAVKRAEMKFKKAIEKRIPDITILYHVQK